MRTIGRKCVQRALTITEDENRDRWSEKALKMRTVGQKRSYWPQPFSAGVGGRQNTSRSQSLAFSLLLVDLTPPVAIN